MKLKLCILFLFTSLISYTQQVNPKYFESQEKKLSKVLFEIEKVFEVKFSYLDELLDGRTIKIKKGTYDIETLISVLSKASNLTFERIDDRYFAVYQKEEEQDFFKDNELLDNVVIHAYLAKGITKNKDNSFTILPHKLEVLPGLTEPDVLQTLQQLPGVISPNETVTGLHVRGGTPDQNLVLWNGIQMYHSGHLFGMISGYNSNIDQTIHFYNKGTNPIFGGRISSVISIETSDKIPANTEVSLGVNMLNFDANITVPIIKEKLKLQISARRSFTDLYESFTYKQLSKKVFQHTKIERAAKNENSFFFQDYNAKLHYKISKKSSLSINSIFIDNKLNNLYKGSDESTFEDIIAITNEGYSGKWLTKWNTSFTTSVSAFYSNYFYDYDFIKNDNLRKKETFSKKNKVLDSGVSFNTDYTLNKNMLFNVGYQYVAQDVSHAFISKTPVLTIVYDSKAGFIQTHSLYSSLKYHTYNIIALNVGARYSYISYFNKFVLEPRVLFNYTINKELKATVSAEIKNQTISQIQETLVNDLGIENQLWRVSDNDRFPLLNVKQVTTGMTYTHKDWIFDIDTYLKETNGLTTLTFGFFNNLDPNFHIGKSKSFGIDFYLKKDFTNFKTWMTYSFNSTKNKFEQLNNYQYFPVNAEIQHVVNAAMSYKYRNWQFALGWYWHTGKPFTKVSLLDVKEPALVFDKFNASRLPNYHRLDISSIWNFSLSKSNNIKGKLGLSVTNLYNRSNILNREYLINEEKNTLEILDKKSLQFNPNIFFRVDF